MTRRPTACEATLAGAAPPMPLEDQADAFALRDALDPEYPGFHGDQARWAAARDRLILSFTPLAHQVAREFLRSDPSLELKDLLAAGQMGLLHAAGKYDRAKGARFSTYATFWVRSHVRKEAARTGPLIAVPHHFHPACRRGSYAGSPDREHASRALACRGRGWSGQAGDPLERLPFPDRDTARGPGDHPLDLALARLTARQAAVIRCRWLDGRDRPTLKQAGAILGLSWRSVKESESNALDRLRQLLRPSPALAYA